MVTRPSPGTSVSSATWPASISQNDRAGAPSSNSLVWAGTLTCRARADSCSTWSARRRCKNGCLPMIAACPLTATSSSTTLSARGPPAFRQGRTPVRAGTSGRMPACMWMWLWSGALVPGHDGGMLQVFGFDRIGVVVGDIYFIDPAPAKGQEGPERGVRLEVRMLEPGELTGSIYSARPISIAEPIWRANLLESADGPPGSLNRAHHHPAMRA